MITGQPKSEYWVSGNWSKAVRISNHIEIPDNECPDFKSKEIQVSGWISKHVVVMIQYPDNIKSGYWSIQILNVPILNHIINLNRSITVFLALKFGYPVTGVLLYATFRVAFNNRVTLFGKIHLAKVLKIVYNVSHKIDK